MFGRFSDHQALVITTDMHDADVVTHDEQNVGFLVLSLCHAGSGDDGKDRQNSHDRFHVVSFFEVRSGQQEAVCVKRQCSPGRGERHGFQQAASPQRSRK